MPDPLTPLYRNFGLAPLPNVIDQLIRESVVTPNRFFGRFLDAATPCNLIESDGDVYLQLVLPGVEPTKIDLHVVGRELTVVAKVGVPKIEGKYLIHGLPNEEEFTQTFTLPVEVNGDKATAKYEHGILTIAMPKAEFAKAKTIPVSATV